MTKVEGLKVLEIVMTKPYEIRKVQVIAYQAVCPECGKDFVALKPAQAIKYLELHMVKHKNVEL